jgi:hypothetical protein
LPLLCLQHFTGRSTTGIPPFFEGELRLYVGAKDGQS